MGHNYPALIIIIPLLSAFVIAGLGWYFKRLCYGFALVALFSSFGCAVKLLLSVLSGGPFNYNMAGWEPPWGISYHIDYLNAPILVVILIVAILNLISSKSQIDNAFPNKYGAFYTLYVLFVTGMVGIVITGDAFNLYVLLEIASITGYALVGLGGGRSALSALNYVFAGTIGASFYLLGVGYLYLVTGSLNMHDLSILLPNLYQNNAVLFALVFTLTGLFIKMALFPLHAWLPNVYTHAPSPSASLLSPLMTKVMIYVMIRVVLYVYTPEYAFKTIDVSTFIVWLAVFAIVMGAVNALAQNNVKTILTYIIVMEVGYMVGGFWLGNKNGMTGAILHILNDAVMTLAIFLTVNAFQFHIRKTALSTAFTLDDLKGLFRDMPFTMAAFIISVLSIIGVPPTCGFFSKWYLILGGIDSGQYGFVAALLISSLTNVILFMKMIEKAYFEPMDHGHHHGRVINGGMEKAKTRESFISALPLLITALTLILMGMYTRDIVVHFILHAIPGSIS